MTIKLQDNVINIEHVVEIGSINYRDDYVSVTVYYTNKGSSTFTYYYEDYEETSEQVKEQVVILRNEIRRYISDSQVDLQINLKKKT